MNKTFYLPFLSALAAVTVSCNDRVTIDQYQRLQFNSYAECVRYYQAQINAGLQNPCYQVQSSHTSSFIYFGPYFYNTGGTVRYLGYTPQGQPASSGLSYDQKRRTYGSFKAGGTQRGGFGSRSGSFGG